MSAWIETFRGTVPPWECDVTEHFTIAYYFDRIEQASANLADALGAGEVLRAGALPRRFHVRFVRELRAGASFHIDSAAIAAGPDGLRLGHRILDSANGETVTWVAEEWGSPAPVALDAARLARWEAPAEEARPEPGAGSVYVPTVHGRVRPLDLDARGVFSLTAFVHRFTDACIQVQAAIGIDALYMLSERRGYSTFELALTLAGDLHPGEAYRVETTVAHLGSSSVRFVHRLNNAAGAEIARLGQFGVNLDLDARRPAPLPEPIRARAQRLLAPAG